MWEFLNNSQKVAWTWEVLSVLLPLLRFLGFPWRLWLNFQCLYFQDHRFEGLFIQFRNVFVSATGFASKISGRKLTTSFSLLAWWDFTTRKTCLYILTVGIYSFLNKTKIGGERGKMKQLFQPCYSPIYSSQYLNYLPEAGQKECQIAH